MYYIVFPNIIFCLFLILRFPYFYLSSYHLILFLPLFLSSAIPSRNSSALFYIFPLFLSPLLVHLFFFSFFPTPFFRTSFLPSPPYLSLFLIFLRLRFSLLYFLHLFLIFSVTFSISSTFLFPFSHPRTPTLSVHLRSFFIVFIYSEIYKPDIPNFTCIVYKFQSPVLKRETFSSEIFRLKRINMAECLHTKRISVYSLFIDRIYKVSLSMSRCM